MCPFVSQTQPTQHNPHDLCTFCTAGASLAGIQPTLAHHHPCLASSGRTPPNPPHRNCRHSLLLPAPLFSHQRTQPFPAMLAPPPAPLYPQLQPFTLGRQVTTVLSADKRVSPALLLPAHLLATLPSTCPALCLLPTPKPAAPLRPSPSLPSRSGPLA